MFFNKNTRFLEEVQQQIHIINLENENLKKSLQDCTSQIDLLRREYPGFIHPDYMTNNKAVNSPDQWTIDLMKGKFTRTLDLHM